jgi:hypothetical protein
MISENASVPRVSKALLFVVAMWFFAPQRALAVECAALSNVECSQFGPTVCSWCANNSATDGGVCISGDETCCTSINSYASGGCGNATSCCASALNVQCCALGSTCCTLSYSTACCGPEEFCCPSDLDTVCCKKGDDCCGHGGDSWCCPQGLCPQQGDPYMKCLNSTSYSLS